MSLNAELEIIYTCRRCKKTFETKRDHLLHRETVHDNNPAENKFSCDACGKRFANHGNLYRHLKCHNNIKPHKCHNCDKSFAQAANLIRHFAVHNGDRPYVCNICNKGFTQQGNLRRHELCHTGEKPFRCKSCGRTFSQRVNLNKHLTLHPGYKAYAKTKKLKQNNKLIVVDDRSSINEANSIILGDHVIKEELDKDLVYQCGLCGMVFNNFHDFQAHEIFCEVAGEEQIVETTNIS